MRGFHLWGVCGSLVEDCDYHQNRAAPKRQEPQPGVENEDPQQNNGVQGISKSAIKTGDV